MASQQVDLCQHNQTGFCKFKDKCPRRHENTICENTESCNEETCSKRHLKVCRHFSNNGNCRHGEKCAYKHQQNDGQINLYEQVTLLLLKHEKDITSLKEELNELNNIMQQMAHELMKNIQKGAETEDLSDNVLKCEKCDFTCEKKNYFE